MDNKGHKHFLTSNLPTMLNKIAIHLHHRNKLILYDHYALSKIPLHLAVADFGKTWISENLDNMVRKYVHQWLDLPISATISSIILSQKRFGQAFQLPSIKYQQRQTTLCSSLKSSGDETITKMWKNTNSGTNIQYDVYRNTKQALKSIHSEHTSRHQSQLPSQGLIISFLLEHSLRKLNSLW